MTGTEGEVISMFLLIAPDSENAPREDRELTQSTIDDFKEMLRWGRENNGCVHTVMYNMVAEQNEGFQKLLETIEEKHNKILIPESNAHNMILQSAFCAFLSDPSHQKKMIYYTGHGAHTLKVERKGNSLLK